MLFKFLLFVEKNALEALQTSKFELVMFPGEYVALSLTAAFSYCH
jgi:hypothetical protein